MHTSHKGGFFMSENIKKTQLSIQVINNLTKAEPIRIEQSGYTFPFCYGSGFIKAVIQQCIDNRTLYSSHSFITNALLYLNAYSERLNQFNQASGSNVFSDQGPFPKKDKHRVFFHGRSNGIPTPFGIRAFQLARKLYPESEILFGVDHDKSSTEKNQQPFMNSQFRASCYLAPKIVDNVIYLHPPSDKIKKKIYWNRIYSPNESLQPDVIIIPDDELNGTKKEDSTEQIRVLNFPDIFSKDEYGLFSKIHQTNLKAGDVPDDDLYLTWKKIANELKVQ